jgi:putative PIN family toxin of toxin-antitoxin system
MIRVVIDSNVVVTAIRSKVGWSHKLLFSIGIDRRWQPFLSGPLLQEYTEQVFKHSHIPAWSREECDDFLDHLCASSCWCEVYFLWRPLLQDVDDHMVMEAALAASAEYIITFNKNDLKPAETFGITLMTPREFLLHLAT